MRVCVYDLGLSFFSLYSANSDTLATFTTLKRIPVGRERDKGYHNNKCSGNNDNNNAVTGMQRL